MSIILYGAPVSKEIKEDLKNRVSALISQGKQPKLAVITVGDDYSSNAYLSAKIKACDSVGILMDVVKFDSSATTQDILQKVKLLNNDESVSGITLQTPTASHIDNGRIFDEILPTKDVDGTNSSSFGALCLGKSGFKPATALAVIKILNYYKLDIAGKNAVVVGRSAILGKPASMLLLENNATVTICHSKTKNLPEIISRADILVAAIGKAEFIKSSWIKSGSVVIDAGYNEGNVGDVEAAGLEKTLAYTPVPKGVGPVTTAILLEQTVESAERQN